MELTKHQRPIRILHVVGSMSRGGIETWLMHILRQIDRDRIEMDFVVHKTEPCAYDSEIRALGCEIIPCLSTSNPWLYARNFKRIIREYGLYDVVHSHVHYFSGYVLRLAQEMGVPVRIAHSHRDSSPLEKDANLYRRMYLNLMKSLIQRYANVGLGCSKVAIVDVFGSDWVKDPRCELLYYGINLSAFHEPFDSNQLRTELGIPKDAYVIGHVGRFHEQKNHSFLLEIFAEVAFREPRAYLLLLGEGSLRPSIEQQAKHMGLEERVIFAGTRPDIPQIMKGVMDVFLFPSLCEGLPVVSIEAQAAGLPMILSEAITDELEKIQPLVKKISLSQPVEVWANAVLDKLNDKSKISQAESLNVIENSEFNITYSVKALAKTYIDEIEKAS